MVGYLISVLLLVALVIFIYFDQRKMSSKPKPKSRSNSFHMDSTDATECVRRGIDRSNALQDDLFALFSRHCQHTNSFFKDTPMYENAVAASAAFLLVFCRFCLIYNGILTRDTPKIETAMTGLYRRLLAANGREQFNAYIDYFQSFLPPNNKLPRCDIFAMDDSILSSQEDNYAFILFVAFGDCILNPQLVSVGNSAPISVCDSFDLFNLESILMDRLSPYMSEVIDEFCGHFMIHHEEYSFSFPSLK